MLTEDHFPREYDVFDAEASPSAPDHEFSATGAGARSALVLIQPWAGPSWVGSFAAPEPNTPALSAFAGTPRPTGLCVIERGTAFLGDVLQPARFVALATHGPITRVAEVPAERILLLVTPWSIAAVTADGLVWSTERIAVEGLRIDEAIDGWAHGVADPDDEESRDFSVELATGRVIGGSGSEF
jgi:hypothetical protein